ncbi:hypothetical protein [Cumulibacter manganitolerans]|uniref:hypothetical protein n=1 Tax=Cumulibacter manganitolerans TaxID=1884992 RepID=UPI0012952A41|nr:hypothetical protein [Cumulibacter manganitolerans]
MADGADPPAAHPARFAVTPRVHPVPASRPPPSQPRRRSFEHVAVLDVALLLFVCFGHVLLGYAGWMLIPYAVTGLAVAFVLCLVAVGMARHPEDVSVRTRVAHVLLWLALFCLGVFIRDAGDLPGTDGSIFLHVNDFSEWARATAPTGEALSRRAVEVTVVAAIGSHLVDRTAAWLRAEIAARRR